VSGLLSFFRLSLLPAKDNSLSHGQDAAKRQAPVKKKKYGKKRRKVYFKLVCSSSMSMHHVILITHQYIPPLALSGSADYLA